MGLAADQLRNKALAAIEEAQQEAKAGPVKRTKPLAFALAYLWAYSRGERWPFDTFWRDLASPNDIGRRQSLQASLNAIHRALGLEHPHGSP
jgi:hypothetical protein